MPNIKIGDSTLTNVNTVTFTDADDSSAHIYFDHAMATLNVTAPAGSALTVSQSSIILQTYTLGPSETSHSFKVRKSNTLYTVSATLGTKSDSQDVLADTANEYNIELDYVLWLFRDGNEYTELTGGYIARACKDTAWNWITAHTLTLTKTSTLNVHLQNADGAYGFRTNNAIQFSNKTLFVAFTLSLYKGVEHNPNNFAIRTSQNNSDVYTVLDSVTWLGSNDDYHISTIVSKKITDGNNYIYFQFYFQNGWTSNADLSISQIWLE